MKNRLFFILWLAVLVLLWLPGRLQSAGVILTDSLLAVIVLAIWTYFATKHIKAGFELRETGSLRNKNKLQRKTANRSEAQDTKRKLIDRSDVRNGARIAGGKER